MANLNPTEASVAWVSGAINGDHNAGDTLTEGMCVYLDSSQTWQKSRSTTATLAGSGAKTGIVLTPATTGRRVFVQTNGVINMGTTLAVGTVYVVSATLGEICPIADITTSTHKFSILGQASTTANLDMSLKQAYDNGSGYSGIAVA